MWTGPFASNPATGTYSLTLTGDVVTFGVGPASGLDNGVIATAITAPGLIPVLYRSSVDVTYPAMVNDSSTDSILRMRVLAVNGDVIFTGPAGSSIGGAGGTDGILPSAFVWDKLTT